MSPVGVNAYRVSVDLAQALDNTKLWIVINTFTADEIAIRFSHRLVYVHPFPNGNGRLSRLIGDTVRPPSFS